MKVMVDGRVVRRPCGGHRPPFKLEPWNLCLMLDKMETGRGQLGGPVEHSEGKGGGSVVAILRFLCGNPCLCQLSTEGLVPVSKYQTY
jgi:hypothetical protein